MKEQEYLSRPPDEYGLVHYSYEENEVWRTLYERQMEIIKTRACEEFINGVQSLRLTKDKIPQLPEVSSTLRSLTGWSVAPVKALISFRDFFELLSKRQFPAATFIRRPEHIDYLKEPDIFHELFGHCPMLTNQAFANFTHRVGEIGLSLNKEDRVMLARLYWFTVEFGLINNPSQGLRIYGGGILSSKNESIYALESQIPIREPFDMINILRTPYRYDEMQKKYFIINSFEELFSLVNRDLLPIFNHAKALGLFIEGQSDEWQC